jgi:hypothetical protein
MKSGELLQNDLALLKEHGLVVKMTVEEARSLIGAEADGVDGEVLDDALDNAQGAVHSGSAGRAYVVLVIDNPGDEGKVFAAGAF